MNKYQRKNLRMLGRKLLKLNSNEFDYSTFGKKSPGCKTVACAAGWTPSLWPTHLRLKPLAGWTVNTTNFFMPCFINNPSVDGLSAMQLFFGLPWADTMGLFMPYSQHDLPIKQENLGYDATASEVGNMMIRYANWHRRKSKKK